MTKLDGDLAVALRMHEGHDASPGGSVVIAPQAGTAGGDARFGRNRRHLGEQQATAAQRTRAEMHQIEIVGHTLLAGIHRHR